MQFFIGVIPPPEIRDILIQFNSHSGGSVFEIAEPHITVKAQSGLTEDMGWLQKIEEVARASKKFTLAFDDVDSFGEDVLYLRPLPSQELLSLHSALVEAVDPSDELRQKYFEDGRYTPHLTLGGTSWGLTKEQLATMKNDAMEMLRGLPGFEVTFLRVYRQITDGQPYERFVDVPLG